MKYLIIGNGVAGTEAALTIRKNDTEADIAIISESGHLFYFRPRLVEYLSDDFPKDKMIIYKSDFYENKKIRTILSTRIEKIDAERKQVISSEGHTYSYDKLLIATGARSFIPTIKNYNKNGIFSLRTFKDADLIRNHSVSKEHLVVAGGGLLGLETAFHLGKRYKTVTVVEMGDSLLPRQLDKEGGDFLLEMLKKKGISFELGTVVEQAKGDNSISAVSLKNGKTIPCDCLIISAGVRPRTEITANSDLKRNKGIIVDSRMETSLDDIYAAGDCVEYEDKLYGLWITSKEQGKIAGNVMCGIEDSFDGITPSVVLKITGTDLFSAGDVFQKDVSVESDINPSSFKKILYKNDDPVGVEIIGDKDAIMAARKLMAGKYKVAEFIEDMMQETI